MYRGTIIHFVMQHLDLNRVKNVDQINEQLSEMVAKELLTEDDIALVDVRKIEKFFTGHLGQRLLTAGSVYREVPFVQVYKTSELLPNMHKDNDTLLVQGVIDLYFEEDDHFVLVDYKTDMIADDMVRDALIIRYRKQLLAYKKALEEIKGKRVKEVFLYFFYIDEAISLEI